MACVYREPQPQISDEEKVEVTYIEKVVIAGVTLSRPDNTLILAQRVDVQRVLMFADLADNNVGHGRL